eukprot:CAMPEP_0171147956 /NCGR_PEP_ID=MMETSP0766_2-20121228/148325_1 /TAXON_ID=439317 /ORGANISM="Gambierdiscus australes, Strain CAWD 149" /LENGTH=115 /DNA_ID=CAMNT_0011611865 /DNA_START=982 /DNA_END=1326 /DNA_ORIENTATION=+
MKMGSSSSSSQSSTCCRGSAPPGEHGWLSSTKSSNNGQGEMPLSSGSVQAVNVRAIRSPKTLSSFCVPLRVQGDEKVDEKGDNDDGRVEELAPDEWPKSANEALLRRPRELPTLE